MNLQNTQTLTNLMRAFAGESMAWSRYVRAAEIALKAGPPSARTTASATSPMDIFK